MARITTHLTSISPDLRTGPPPGRRLVALVLSATLALSAVLPGLAAATEIDSEGEGIDVPIETPETDLDPGGEESALGDAPAFGGGDEAGEEAGAVEVEPELDAEAPPPGEVTSAATEAEAVAKAPQAEVPAPVSSEAPESAPEPAPAPQPVQATTPPEPTNEPVENQPLVAPEQKPVARPATDSRDAASEPAPAIETTEAPAPAEPSSEEAPAPAAPQPATRSGEPARNLAGKRFYVVRRGDCLSHIAAALLPTGADTAAIEREVRRLWKLNEERIGTGDPNLIYVGTVLRLR